MSQKVGSENKSNTPVPSFGHWPKIMLLLGVKQESVSLNIAALIINLIEVSNDIRWNGLALFAIQILFIALTFPKNVT